MAGFAMVLGGMAKGAGNSLMEAAKERRAERKAEIERQFQLARDKTEMDFRATEADKARQFQIDNAQGDLIDMGSGRMGVRRGAKVEPLVDNAGKEITVSAQSGYRQLSPDEVKSAGLDPSKAYQVSLSGDDKGKISAIGGGDTNITVGGEKFTEGQSKDLGYFTRGLYADDELSTIDTELTDLGGNVAGRFGVPGNYYKDPKYRKAERAGRDFLAIILRKDTGAAVTAQEFDMYGQIFLPWPGDDEETVKAKREARARALTAIERGLGTARKAAEEVRGEFEAEKARRAPGDVKPSPAPAIPNVGDVVDGYRFNGGDPADQKNWERVQ